jgi:hypothetical protein
MAYRDETEVVLSYHPSSLGVAIRFSSLNRKCSYSPTGGVGLVLAIVLILLLAGRL